MLRPVFKLMTFVSVTLTFMTSVIDGARSIVASYLIVTPLNQILANIFQSDIYSINHFIHNLVPSFLSSICITLAYLPAWSIFGALAVAFYTLSYEQKKPFHKISYQEEQYV
ncbi:hypothetical protein NPX98_00260 [Bartonella sp. A5(2022)]|nr:hypothetical protein [Bartonella sp. A05]